MARFEVINGEEAERVRAMRPGYSQGITAALAAGQVLWFPGAKLPSVGSWSSFLKTKGYRLTSRRDERDGVKGIYMWAVPLASDV